MTLKLSEVYPNPTPDPSYLKRGDKIRLITDKESYIIASVDTKHLILIGLIDGNRWAGAAEVKSWSKITRDEMCELVGTSNFREWELIDND